MVLADLAAWSHAAFIAFLIGGGIAALRWPRVLWFHVPAVIGMATVNVLGLDCPFTVVQKHFMATPYEGGFIEHYLVDPVHPGGITAPVRAVIIACWVIPTALAYHAFWRRSARAA